MLNTGISLQRLATKAGVGFTPKKLFSNGEAGVWYDPSDVEASLTWRRNLLEYTESFTGWNIQTNTVRTPNQTAPDGTNTASKFVSDGSNGFYKTGIPTGINVATRSIWLKGVSGGETVLLKDPTLTNNIITCNLTSEWQRFELSEWNGHAIGGGIWVDDIPVGGIYAWGPQVELGSTATEYQPIRTTFNNAFKQAFPKHTLYQDHNGGTPVTGLGQAVGLMLDKSEGVALTEKFDDTEFDVPSEWSLEPQLSITNGELDLASSATTGGAGAYTDGATVVGRMYRIEFEVAELSGTSIHAALCNSAGGSNQQAVTPSVITTGKHTFTITATGANTTGARLRFSKGSGQTAKVLNFSMKEVSGSHATQSDSTKRPVFARHPERGRVNLFKYTEEFDNGAWSKTDVTLTANDTSAPNGTQTAYKITASASASFAYIRQNLLLPVGKASGSYYVKAGNTSVFWIYSIGTSQYGAAYFDVSDQTTQIVAGGQSSPSNLQILDVGNGWYKISATFDITSALTQGVGIGVADAKGSTNVTSGKYGYVWGAQTELANEATGYQKVVDDYDITESGYKSVYYLQFDGINDGMQINNLTSSSTPLTALFGYSSTGQSDTDYIFDVVTGRTIFGLRNGFVRYLDGAWSEFAADTNSIKVLTYDMVEDNAKIRINGNQEYTDTSYDQKAISGDIGLYQAFSQTGAYLAGNLYQYVIRAAESTDKEIDQAEEFVAIKTGLKSEVVGLATLDLNFGANTYTARNSNGSAL